MNNKVKGTLCGIIAAICYGTNPLGALFLYQDNVNTNTILTHRFGLAAIILAIIMLIRKDSFRLSKRELLILGSLGVLFAASSMTLYSSFLFMDAGIASTILFVYPIMVAIIMTLFFKEKQSIQTALSIALATLGIVLLNKTATGEALNIIGIILTLVSSLTYAIYIVIINRTQIEINPFKMTFYVLLFCVSCIIIHSCFSPQTHLQPLPYVRDYVFAFLLAFIPTIFSLVLMTISIRNIGSTPAAIMGALEPLTAVLIGITIFGEVFTGRLAAGIVLILAGVTLIILKR